MGERINKSDLIRGVVHPHSPESGDGWQRRRSEANVYCCEGDSMTEQSHKDTCDINVIMDKYEKTGVAPGVNENGRFGDFSGAVDYHSSVNAVMEAEEAFMQLPAKIRKRFDNDPGQLLAFLDDPKNAEESVNLGLRVARPQADATLKDVVDELKKSKKDAPK